MRKFYIVNLLLVASWAANAHTVVINSMEGRIAQLELIANTHSKLLNQFHTYTSDNKLEIDALRGQVQEIKYNLSKFVDRQNKIIFHINSKNTLRKSSSKESEYDIANTYYTEAVELVLKKKNFDQAILAFNNFVQHYSNSPYQPNAHYWLGQLNYNKGKKDAALYYFALVVKKYPKALKASESLLKVGIIMQEKGNTDKAKAVYQQVAKLYPGAESANKAKQLLASL